MRKAHIRREDVRGLNALTHDAVVGIVDLVETMHNRILTNLGVRPLTIPNRVIYFWIRRITRLVTASIDGGLAVIPPWHTARPSSREREAVIAALNGVLGDHLQAHHNPLTIPMQWCRDGVSLELTTEGLQRSISNPTGKILILLHGLCMNDQQWERNGLDYGRRLETDLGFTPIYLRYNTGLHISTNGRAFAALLEDLVAAWPVPVEEVSILCHSMGGLVARSACHYAAVEQYAWRKHLQTLVFLCTPHAGAPAERIGNWVDRILMALPTTAALARIGKIRSAGITDLRYGSLLDNDWHGVDRFVRRTHRPTPVPLPTAVRCASIGVTVASNAGDLQDRLVGDGLVPLTSALGLTPELAQCGFENHERWMGSSINHFEVLNHPDVYAQLEKWFRG